MGFSLLLQQKSALSILYLALLDDWQIIHSTEYQPNYSACSFAINIWSFSVFSCWKYLPAFSYHVGLWLVLPPLHYMELKIFWRLKWRNGGGLWKYGEHSNLSFLLNGIIMILIQNDRKLSQELILNSQLHNFWSCIQLLVWIAMLTCMCMFKKTSLSTLDLLSFLQSYH